MAVYDIEQLLVDINGLLEENLPSYIESINTAKADEIKLLLPEKFIIDATAQTINTPVFVQTSISEIESINNGGEASYNIVFQTDLVASKGDNTDLFRKCLRYTQAMQNCLKDNYEAIRRVKLESNQLIPIEWEVNGVPSIVSSIEIRTSLNV